MHLTLSSVLGIINLAYFEAWLSLVERCVRDAEVVGSNPVASMLVEIRKCFILGHFRVFIFL